MKLIIAILLLAITTFAQNTTYKDGTDCECDSINTVIVNYTYSYAKKYNISIVEYPYKNGNINGIVKEYVVSKPDIAVLKHKILTSLTEYYDQISVEILHKIHVLNVDAYNNITFYMNTYGSENSDSIKYYINYDKDILIQKLLTQYDSIYTHTLMKEIQTTYIHDVIFSKNSDNLILLSKVVYSLNKPIGIKEVYNDDGELIKEEPYKNGLLNGIVVYYYKGSKSGTARYKNGDLVGYKKCNDGRVGNENLDCLKWAWKTWNIMITPITHLWLVDV